MGVLLDSLGYFIVGITAAVVARVGEPREVRHHLDRHMAVVYICSTPLRVIRKSGAKVRTGSPKLIVEETAIANGWEGAVFFERYSRVWRIHSSRKEEKYAILEQPRR